jgi:hypothetical protein
MRFYLAHPLKARHEIRTQELQFEKNTGIELLNPFYDPKGESHETEDIKSLDKATRNAWSDQLDYHRIVEDDIHAIDNCDGTVGWVEKTVHTIGTQMELWDTYLKGKPVYIITPDWPNHPWLKYIAEKSHGGIFGSFAELEKHFTK